jgi:putative photosynthetic complex assembly protein
MTLSSNPVPRKPLLAVWALVAATLVFAATARLTGLGTATTPDLQTVSQRDLRFEDRSDGGIDILDARSRERIGDVDPGTNGFLRSAMRGLARERRRSGFDDTQPFRLLGRADGRLTLEDPATGRRIDLESFGSTNSAVFARLLPASTS